MESIVIRIAFVCGLMFAAGAQAQAPAGAPAGTTGLCKDGTYYSGATKKGACKGHQGVKQWWGAKAAAAAPAAGSAGAAASAGAGAAKPAAAAAAKAKPATTAAAGGSPGDVWVNTESKVYHCTGDKWYGKTKEGQYMTESEATAKGYRPSRGKACK